MPRPAIPMPRKAVLLALLLGGWALPASQSFADGATPSQAKPFNRAIILSGMGLNFVTYLGLYDAALDAGVEPDLVIGASGGAVAAAIIAAFPDRQDRRRFLESEQFYRFFEAIEVEHPRPASQIGHMVRLASGRLGIPPLTPNLETRPLIAYPEQIRQSLDVPFPSRPDTPAIVLIAGRLDYPPGCAVRLSRKLFTETWFTDPATAGHLRGIPSPVGDRFRWGGVNRDTAVVDHVSITQAMRASISEPLLLEPAVIDNDRYIGGGIDAWPVEMADRLAEETVVPRPNDLTFTIRLLFDGVFRYGSRRRWKEVERLPCAITVDMADYRDRLRDATFWFQIRKNPQGGGATSPRKILSRYQVVFDGPKDHEDFLAKTRIQYEYGYERGQESFAR